MCVRSSACSTTSLKVLRNARQVHELRHSEIVAAAELDEYEMRGLL